MYNFQNETLDINLFFKFLRLFLEEKKKMRSNKKRTSFKTKLCSSKNDDTDFDDRENVDDGYFDNEKNYLLCGIICTKSMVIIFNFLFIVSNNIK